MPVVIMCETTKAGFDATNDDGYIGEEFLEDACIDDGGVFGAKVMATIW